MAKQIPEIKVIAENKPSISNIKDLAKYLKKVAHN